MKFSVDLTAATRPEWVKTVMADLPAFMQDHADCERKASAMAMSFVAKYPDRVEIIQQVYAHMSKRGIHLAKEMKQDPYIQGLMDLCKTDPINRFLDRLLLASIIECRGAERFRLVCNALDKDPELKDFYHGLWTSEAKHGNIFVKMALRYFPEKQVYERLNELNRAEGKLIERLPFRAALH